MVSLEDSLSSTMVAELAHAACKRVADICVPEIQYIQYEASRLDIQTISLLDTLNWRSSMLLPASIYKLGRLYTEIAALIVRAVYLLGRCDKNASKWQRVSDGYGEQ